MLCVVVILVIIYLVYTTRESFVAEYSPAQILLSTEHKRYDALDKELLKNVIHAMQTPLTSHTQMLKIKTHYVPLLQHALKEKNKAVSQHTLTFQ
jgi:hypothetical protein